MNIDSGDLFVRILGDVPKPLGTYRFQIGDVDGNILALFEFCMDFFHTASKHLYGDSDGTVDITRWDYSNIEVLRNYFRSMCINFNVRIIDPGNDVNNELVYYYKRRYDRTELVNETNVILSDLYYILKINKTGMYYILSYDIIPDL